MTRVLDSQFSSSVFLIESFKCARCPVIRDKAQYKWVRPSVSGLKLLAQGPKYHFHTSHHSLSLQPFLPPNPQLAGSQPLNKNTVSDTKMNTEKAYNESRETDAPGQYTAPTRSPDQNFAPNKTQFEWQGKSEKAKQNAGSMGSQETGLTYWTKFSVGCVIGTVLAVLLEVYWWAPRRACVEVQR
jgi:hypothetical protein